VRTFTNWRQTLTAYYAKQNDTGTHNRLILSLRRPNHKIISGQAKIAYPGLASDMTEKPDYGEESYRGLGRLEGW